MNVAARDKLKKNEKARKKETIEQKEKRKTTDFRESVCCSFVVVHCSNGSTGKNVWLEKSSEYLGLTTVISTQLKGVGHCITRLRRLLIGADLITLFGYMIKFTDARSSRICF